MKTMYFATYVEIALAGVFVICIAMMQGFLVDLTIPIAAFVFYNKRHGVKAGYRAHYVLIFAISVLLHLGFWIFTSGQVMQYVELALNILLLAGMILAGKYTYLSKI